MSAPRPWTREFGSHADFYRTEYGQHLAALHPVGGLGASLIEAHQTAGDWSDAPTPDLVLGWLRSRPVGFSIDLGAGRFTGAHRSGDAILAAPGAGTLIEMHGCHVCHMLALPYNQLATLADGLRAGLPSDGDFGRLHAGLIRDRHLTTLLGALWSEASGGSPHGPLWADGALLQIVACLLRLRAGEASVTVQTGLAPWQVRRTTEYLCNNLQANVSLRTLAGLAGLSPFHFARQFKHSTGLPPHAYLRRLRCEKARALLASTGLSVGEVAAAVGYETPQAFARMFRAETGASPGEYRRERRS